MISHNVTGGCFWQPFVFHAYLLYMSVELWDDSRHYGEAMNVKYAAPVETQIVKE